VQKASWSVPKDHPDLVAGKESRRLLKLFTDLKGDAESAKLPADYQKMLAAAIEGSRALDAAVASQDHAAATAQFELLNKGCKSCHKSFRDNS
jgi:cytochrome c556